MRQPDLLDKLGALLDRLTPLLLIVLLGLAVIALIPNACAEHDPLDYIMTQTITFGRAYNPQLTGPDTNAIIRVNLDLSLDGGATWHTRIAHGLPCRYGTQDYVWSFHCTPDLWTERARIGVRTLWGSTTNVLVQHHGGQSATNFAICGVRIVSPTNNETVLQPGYKAITWHEAGASSVDIGVSTNAGISWTKLYTVASPDPTNSWSVPIMGYSTGRLDFIVQAVGNLTDLWDTVTVQVENQ